MTIERKTRISQIEITGDNLVQVRIALTLMDGEKELSCKWHRTAFDPKAHPDMTALQMNEVNNHLIMMGELPVSPEDIARIAAHAALAAQSK